MQKRPKHNFFFTNSLALQIAGMTPQMILCREQTLVNTKNMFLTLTASSGNQQVTKTKFCRKKNWCKFIQNFIYGCKQNAKTDVTVSKLTLIICLRDAVLSGHLLKLLLLYTNTRQTIYLSSQKGTSLTCEILMAKLRNKKRVLFI